MKNILAFTGSNSTSSINKEILNFTASLVDGAEVEIIDLKDFEPPMFSLDLEQEIGSHATIKALVEKIESADALIISTPEHNSMPPAFFKNILDWLSRTAKVYMDGRQYLQDKPVLLMSVAPGKGAGRGARALVGKMIGYANANIVSEYEFPEFFTNFSDGKITSGELENGLKEAVYKLTQAI
jgi:NAD(P)H-dependent FMN reductase